MYLHTVVYRTYSMNDVYAGLGVNHCSLECIVIVDTLERVDLYSSPLPAQLNAIKDQWKRDRHWARTVNNGSKYQ